MGAPRNLTDGVLVVKDGTGSPKTLTVVLDQGELKFSKKRKVDPVYNRGAIAAVREGRAQMHDVSMKVAFDFLSGDTSGTVPSLKEALYGDGLALSQTWVGTDAAAGSAYCVNMTLTIASPKSGEKGEVITFTKFYIESYDLTEGETANMADIKGKCISITSTRA